MAYKIAGFAGRHGEYWVFVHHKTGFKQTRKIVLCVSQANIVFGDEWEMVASYHTEDGMRFLYVKE